MFWTNYTNVEESTKNLNQSFSIIIKKADRDLTEHFKNNHGIFSEKEAEIKLQVKQEVAQALTKYLQRLGIQVKIVLEKNGGLKLEATEEAMEKARQLLTRQIKSMEDEISILEAPGVENQALKEDVKKLETKKQALEQLKKFDKIVKMDQLTELNNDISVSLDGINKAIDESISQMSGNLASQGPLTEERKYNCTCISIAVGTTLTVLAAATTIIGGVLMACLFPAGIAIAIMFPLVGGATAVLVGVLLTTAAVQLVDNGHNVEINNINSDAVSGAISKVTDKLNQASEAIQKSATIPASVSR